MWEPVLTINDFYDRPRFGVANYRGVPHMYDSPFDEALDDYAEYYYLAPIDTALLQLVLEDWALWERWEDAYYSGRVQLGSHPCLPEDRPAHERLKALIGERFRIGDRSGCEKCRAEFRTVSQRPRRLEVRWTPRGQE